MYLWMYKTARERHSTLSGVCQARGTMDNIWSDMQPFAGVAGK